jgi:two-component system NtrC family sensor kinase
VLDWHMPGLGGVDICRRLSQRNAAYVHSILITNAIESERLVEALGAGASDFLTKPVVPDELEARLGVGRRVLHYHDQLAEKSTMLQRYADDLEALAATRAKQLLHAERMATLGSLTAGVAHEINNPTTFISGNAQALSQFWPDIERVLRCQLGTLDAETRRRMDFVLEEVPRVIKSMHGGVKRISNIVKGLKAYSRQGAGSRQACDVNHCVESAIELCGHDLLARGVHAELRLAPDLPLVHADSQQIEQVLINLAVNGAQAMQAMLEGDRGTPERVLVLSSTSDGHSVRICVDDVGPGILPELMERIWQPFFTTKPVGEGTGLGLSICRNIIKEHEGELTVENRTNGGARFTIALPLSRSATR